MNNDDGLWWTVLIKGLWQTSHNEGLWWTSNYRLSWRLHEGLWWTMSNDGGQYTENK